MTAFHRYQRSIFFIAGILSFVPAAGFGESSALDSWSGGSGGFKVVWNHDVIKATDTAGKVFYVAGSEAKYVQTTPTPTLTPTAVPNSSAGADEDDSGDQSFASFSILSLVGPYASLSRKDVVQLAPDASTSVFETYYTVRLDNPEKHVQLDEIFPAEDIFKALKRDKVVKKVLADLRLKEDPSNLAELAKRLAKRSVLTRNRPAGSDGNAFSEAPLENFSFHHLEKDSVAVRIYIPAVDAKFEKVTALGLLLKIPDNLRSALMSAHKRKEGFLNDGAPTLRE